MARWNPAHVAPKVKLCMQTRIQVCRSKGLSVQCTIFGSFWPDANTKGVWPYRVNQNISLMTLILNIYKFGDIFA